jgi:hypothetical protein
MVNTTRRDHSPFPMPVNNPTSHSHTILFDQVARVHYTHFRIQKQVWERMAIIDRLTCFLPLLAKIIFLPTRVAKTESSRHPFS